MKPNQRTAAPLDVPRTHDEAPHVNARPRLEFLSNRRHRSSRFSEQAEASGQCEIDGDAEVIRPPTVGRR